jgi:probable biosynthetic protein (TIGR04098 family)
LIDRIVRRTLGRNEYESLALRRYFERTYGIKVGLYSIGGFDRWRIPPDTVIGRYCSIAKSARLLDANHPMDALSTHPYFYLKEFGLVPGDLAHLQPPVVEDDVWLGHNCVITPSCHRIGRGAIVGAGAVVMSDVPAYAVMAGAPARLIRYRFPPETIAALEASRWWELDRHELRRALEGAPGMALHPTAENVDAFLRHLGRSRPAQAVAEPAAIERLPAGAAADSSGMLMDVLAREIPDFTSADMDRLFKDLKIDSFGMINLRLALEKNLGAQIPDRAWGAVERPADLWKIAGGQPATSTAPLAGPTPRPPEPLVNGPSLARPAGERRMQPINMPQMAISGLSEAWLFKEIGDIHWSVLTRGLRTPSAAVADSEGNRLYATFTRICLTLEAPLTDFKENDTLEIDLAMSRFGAGMFFSKVGLQASGPTGRAEVMTSFSKFGEAGANTSLLKGQPTIPPDCEITSLDELPEFSHVYRAQRAAAPPPPVFETEYEIVPPHDINGVGLLYFAAYPMIVDVCALRHGGLRLSSEFSTTFRDVYYFANSTPDETLVFRIHRWDETPGAIAFEASLSRKSDGKMMAWIKTGKARVRAAAAPVEPKKKARQPVAKAQA